MAPTRAIDEDDIAATDGSEGLERPRDLALDVEGGSQPSRQNSVKLDREIRHEPRV